MRAIPGVCLHVFILFLVVSFLATPVVANVSANHTSLKFGSVTVNAQSAPTVIVLTNNGANNADIQSVSSSSGEFIVTGASFPLTLRSGKKVSISVVFKPTVASVVSASLVVTIVRHYAGTVTVPLSGTGVAVPAPTHLLSSSAASVAFGNISVGSSSSQSVTLSNTGNSTVNISQLSLSGAGFSTSGLTVPVSIAAGKSVALQVTFSPAASGASTGSISIASNASNSPAKISLGGTGVQPQISVVPGSVNFGSVTVGLTNTQTVTISNPGNANLTLTQATVAGTGFARSGITLPLTVAPGTASAFTVSFAPTSAAATSGSVTLLSSASTASLSVPLSGTGVAQVRLLSASPAALNFGTLALQSSASQAVTISNTGNSAVTISQLNFSGAGFSHSGISLPITLAAGQSTSFNAIFDPTTAGSVSGAATVVSTATNSPETIALSGIGAAPASHSISLSWQPSSSSVVGYNVYESSQSGGPYTRMNSTPSPSTSYSDTNVVSGDTYYFVTTAVDSAGVESVYSNQAVAVVP